MQSVKLTLTKLILASSTMLVFANTAHAWNDCSWHKVGYNKSHFTNQGDWCPNEKFIVQLDLDGGGYGSKDMGNYPIVAKVRCCRPTGSSAGSQSGQKYGKKTSAITSSDTELIWAEIEKIKKALGIK